MDVNNVLWGLSCVVYAGLIVWAFQRRHGNDRSFALFLAFLIFLLVANILRLLLGLNLLGAIGTQMQSRFPLYIAFIISIFIFVITVEFLHTGPIHWFWRGLTAVWLLGAIFINENLYGLLLDEFPIGSYTIARSAVGFLLLLCGWVFYDLRAIILTFFTYQQTLHPLHRNRYLFWIVGVLVNVVGIDFSVATQLAPVGELIIAFSTGIIGYTIFTHDLPDVRLFGKRSLSFLSSIVLSLTIYILALFLLKSVAVQINLGDFFQILILAGFITLLLNPLIKFIQELISRVIFKSEYDIDQLISDYGKKISNIIDLTHLADVIFQTITAGMDIHYVTLFLVNQEDDYFNWVEVKTAATEHDPIQVRIAQYSPVARYLNYEHKPLAQYDIDLLPRFKNTPTEEVNVLKELAIDVYVSVFVKDRWIGLLGLGTKKSGNRYFDKELFLLETLADQTAVALENARLYEDLKQNNAENERLNYELTAANQELSRLDKAKSDFINIASHELRTPLTRIIGYNDILRDLLAKGSVVDSTSLQMMDGVRKAARRLEEIVNTMFDVSKLDTSTLELSMAPVAMGTVIDSAYEKWKDALVSRKQTLTMQDLQKLPTTFVDGNRMIQVFSHLIQNAIKYTPDGGKITITGEVIGDPDKGPQSIEVIVADTGIGIAPDELERIFEKFYRVGNVLVHSSGDTKFKGAGPGLGLTICRGIVEAHGGRVWAESPYHDELSYPGSKFHVLIPIVTSQPKK
jgi:signal transduction histidine kinase